jgi:hypothetical protein
MPTQRAIDLASVCTEAVRCGKAFPTIWHKRLRCNPLVEGIPRQKLEAGRRLLTIPLITGERLVYDADAKGFSVQ